MKEMAVIRGKYHDNNYGTIRTIYDCDEMAALFCARDVAKALGFSDPSRTVRNICRNCVKEAHTSGGGPQVMNFIGWEDVARLYYHCRNQELYQFIEYLNNLEINMHDKAVERNESFSNEFCRDLTDLFTKYLYRCNSI